MQEGVGSGNSYKTLKRTFFEQKLFIDILSLLCILEVSSYILSESEYCLSFIIAFSYISFTFVLLLYLTSSSCFSLLLFYFIRHQTLLCSLIKASIRHYRAYCRVFRPKPIYVMHNCTFLATHIFI